MPRYESKHCEASGGQNIDPRRLLERLRSGAGGGVPGGAEGAARGESSFAGSRSGGPGVLEFLEPRAFLSHIVPLIRAAGAEHEVRFDLAAGRVVKFTLHPMEDVNDTEIELYLERLALTNEVFGDDYRVAGWVEFPGEQGVRLVFTQPWYRTRNGAAVHPDDLQIWSYMTTLGFLRVGEGMYHHPGLQLAVSDAVGKNFVLDLAGVVKPVDLQVMRSDASMRSTLERLAEAQPAVRVMTATEIE
jgi:hypothetical protein